MLMTVIFLRKNVAENLDRLNEDNLLTKQMEGGTMVKKYSWTVYLIILSVLILTGCSSAVNDHVKSMYNIGREAASDGLSEDVVNAQEAKANANADTAYKALDETNIKQFYDALNVEATSDMPFGQRVVIWMYAGYARIKISAPYIAGISILVGILVFIFAQKNNGLRRFALFGLMLGIPLALVIAVFGYGILADIFMY